MKVDIDLTGNIYCRISEKKFPYSNNRIRNGVTDNLEHLHSLSESKTNNNYRNNSLINKSCFYAGNLYNHFGHFLLESLSRLNNYNSESFIVWSSPTGSSSFKSWQLEILDILGFSNKQHVFITDIHSFDNISITDRGYIIWDRFTEGHKKFLSTVSNKDESYINKKIWLSRVGYETYPNEFIIETVLAKHGWIIINPAEYSVLKQVSLFNSAYEIAGIEGTAFHTMVLAKAPCKNVTIFERRGNTHFNGNYHVINNALKSEHKLILPSFEGKKVNVESIFSSLSIALDKNDLEIISNLNKHLDINMENLSKNKIIDGLRDLSITYKLNNIDLAYDLISVAQRLRPKGQAIKKIFKEYSQLIKNKD